MLCALRMFPFSQAAIKVNSGSGDPKVSKGRSQTSSVLTALWSPPQRRNPCLRERPAMVGSQAVRSRPFGATLHRCWVEQLGGASEDAQSYWQGRFAACALVERFWHTGRPWNSWGVAPNPTRGAASGLRKGQTKRDEVPPLTPFARLSCSLFLTSSACCSFVFFPYFNLSINDVAPNRSGSPSHSAHVAPISA